jgi:hypothetical protein
MNGTSLREKPSAQMAVRHFSYRELPQGGCSRSAQTLTAKEIELLNSCIGTRVSARMIRCQYFTPRTSHQPSLERSSLSDCHGSDDMNCKSDQIRAAWAAGDHIGALRIAARFFDRSSDTKTFKRGMDAYNNPGFYRQLGKDPEQIVCDALDVLARRFNLY